MCAITVFCIKKKQTITNALHFLAFSKQSAKQKETTDISSCFKNLSLEFLPYTFIFPIFIVKSTKSIIFVVIYVNSRPKEMRNQMKP